MEASFADWHKKTLLEALEDMVAVRRQALWRQHGKAYANRGHALPADYVQFL